MSPVLAGVDLEGRVLGSTAPDAVNVANPFRDASTAAML